MRFQPIKFKIMEQLIRITENNGQKAVSAFELDINVEINENNSSFEMSKQPAI